MDAALVHDSEEGRQFSIINTSFASLQFGIMKECFIQNITRFIPVVVLVVVVLPHERKTVKLHRDPSIRPLYEKTHNLQKSC